MDALCILLILILYVVSMLVFQKYKLYVFYLLAKFCEDTVYHQRWDDFLMIKFFLYIQHNSFMDTRLYDAIHFYRFCVRDSRPYFNTCITFSFVDAWFTLFKCRNVNRFWVWPRAALPVHWFFVQYLFDTRNSCNSLIFTLTVNSKKICIIHTKPEIRIIY